MRITALLENTTLRDDMKTEHGLSLFIETEKNKILFDMGQTAAFAENAKTLGIDLSQVDMAVLSHGHYDHGGGLETFLKINERAPIYVNPRAFLPHYNAALRYIGLDPSFAKEERIVYTESTHRISPSLCLYSCNEKERKHSLGHFGLSEMTNGCLSPDDFRHEQYLLIEEEGKRILISGCSHKGILDIAEWFRPDTLIGGFHLSKMPIREELQDTANALAAYPTEFYTCHCTGEAQLEFMRQTMTNVHSLSCGQHIIL